MLKDCENVVEMKVFLGKNVRNFFSQKIKREEIFRTLFLSMWKTIWTQRSNEPGTQGSEFLNKLSR